ncbi:hypothetical protein SLEP1_g37900 [Rubroshorea leprosula]|uniref:Uncharacterized protein n=1 Tax=Rubroshorea leprosula TaxID=152421 RepID=A0AAV5KW59_9ROSI|nr:hypothetical protein SLEP1_g37900 [Rubroshorea leprosula]
MAESIVSFITDQLKTTIIEKVKEEVTLLIGVKEEVKRLERNLKLIRTVLADAEEKKTTDVNVKQWLDSLKEAAYDMEDALDEWRTAVELEVHGADDQNAASTATPSHSHHRKVLCNLLSCFPFRRLDTRHKIALNIKKINKRLDKIAKEKDRYNLMSKEEVELPKRPESSSFVDVSHILGRDVVKSEILSYLLGGDGDSETIETISMVGFGGLGKTALAQLIYNEQAVQKHFDKVLWVCVSDLFDEKKVAKAIIQGLDNISGAEAYGLELESLQVLLERISKSVRGKKFLLILDDVWAQSGERWESLKVTFRKGSGGSRILVTTRDVHVATMMGSSQSQVIHLERLGDEVCWLILCEIAFMGREQGHAEHLEEIGRRIAARCKGLPLAAKTLGSLLKFKRSKRQWEDVLNSEIWKLDLAQKEIFAPLLLSYYDLPHPIRRCFKYCVIYLKDRLFWARDLIDRWMAQGYLGLQNDADLESIGQDYFDFLASRSFFQEFEMREGGTMLTFKMHDMIHDFAKYLAEDEFVTKEVHCDDDLNIELEKSRHLTLVLHGEVPFPSSISGVEKLRSLLISCIGRRTGQYSVLEALPSILNKSRRLRLLDLSWACDYFGKQVPIEIGKLIHLRHLTLEGCAQIQELPQQLSNLRNLLELDLKLCENLKELPCWIVKLINLRTIRTSGCEALTHYPKCIRRLTSLRSLMGAIVRADCNDAQEFSIADLGNLKHLWRVWLKVKGDTIDREEARKAQLYNTEDLRIYLTGQIQNVYIIEALDPPHDANVQFFDNYLYV